MQMLELALVADRALGRGGLLLDTRDGLLLEQRGWWLLRGLLLEQPDMGGGLLLGHMGGLLLEYRGGLPLGLRGRLRLDTGGRGGLLQDRRRGVGAFWMDSSFILVLDTHVIT